MQLTKKEYPLFKELISLNLDLIQESDIKTKLEYLLYIYNSKNYQDFTTIINKFNTTKEDFFKKAFNDTLKYFFEPENKYFTEQDIQVLEKDFLYLIEYDIFTIKDNIVIANNFLRQLKYIYETFDSIDKNNHSRNYTGTAFFSCSYKAGTEKYYKRLNDQLNQNYPFKLISDEDISRTKVIRLSFRTLRNHEPIANFMMTMNSLYNLNNLQLDLTKSERKGIEQAFSFINGFKTSNDTLVRSFIIKMSFPYRNKQINKTKVCDAIKNISRYFFEDIVFDKNQSKYKIGISPRYLKLNVYLKTTFLNNLVYAYDRKNEYTYLWKMSMDDAINIYSKMLIELGYKYITENEAYKPLMKKIFSTTIYPI